MRVEKIRSLAIGLHVFVGIGAAAGGCAAIMNPEAPLGINVEALKRGPFDQFLIPGLYLALILGLLNWIAGFLLFRDKAHLKKFPLFFSGFEACALLGWILIQCWILQAVNVLHIIYFAIGAVQGLAALYLLIENYSGGYRHGN